jgi:hypothetical protein
MACEYGVAAGYRAFAKKRALPTVPRLSIVSVGHFDQILAGCACDSRQHVSDR